MSRLKHFRERGVALVEVSTDGATSGFFVFLSPGSSSLGGRAIGMIS